MLVIDDKFNTENIMVTGIANPSIDTIKICVVVNFLSVVVVNLIDVDTHNLNVK